MISIFPSQAQLAGGDGPMPKSLLEKLGADDGFALSIQYSGDLHGSLDTCG